MKLTLRVLIFILLSVSARAQYVQINNLSGTSAYGSLTATVTSGGSFTTWTTWCTTAFGTSYWVGQSGPGWYKFQLNHAVSSLKVFSYAINGGPLGAAEYLELFLNGVPYSFTAADMTNYNDCGSGTGPVYLYTLPAGGPTVIMGTLGTSSDYNGGDFIHSDCAGITEFELYSNGNEAGVTYYVFVDTTFNCFNATVNTPCLGSALYFNNPGDSLGATYVWLGPNSWTTTVATTQSFTITPSVWSDTGTYHIIKTNGTSHDTASVHVTLNYAGPILGTSSNCVLGGTILTDAVTGGTWSSSNTSVATIGATTGLITDLTSGTSIITYTTPLGCIATITINPIAPINGILAMCQGYTTLLSDVLAGGTWSSSTPSVATVNNSGLVTGLGGGTATINYLLPTGCSASTVVTVHPKPMPPVVEPPTICQFTPLTLSATPSTGLLWYGPGVTVGSTFAPAPPTTTPGITNYWVTETSTFGCVSDSAIDPVTVIAQPPPPVATNSIYCEYSDVAPLNFQVDSLSGSHLTWYNTLTGGAPYSGIPAVSNNAATYPTGTTWFVSQTIDGCPSIRIPVKVTIVYKPSFAIVPSRDWVCDHDTLTFAYSSTSPLIEGSFHWYMTPGLTIVRGSDTGQAITVRFDTVYGQHYVSLTVGELNNMCSTTDSAQISVIALPTATAHMNPNICLGDTTTLALSNESSTASIFSWFIDGTPLASTGAVSIVAASSNSGGPYSLSWNDTGLHIITVKCTTAQGCKSGPSYDSVDVHALPNATFTYKPKFNNTLCLEDSVQFVATYPKENNSYLWQPIHSFNNDNKAVIWGKVEETQSDITLTVTDPFGCVGTFTQQLDPSSCCTVLFPNAFTPNGDTKNDVFRPLFNGYHNFHYFRIVNRWAQTIFESSNSLPAWDGTFNGVPQDIGTYYYYIQYDCGGNNVEVKGDVTLIR